MAKAWEVVGLGPDVPLERAARLVLDTRFREMMSYREGTILGEDIEQLHSMRVGSRRLRSAMKNFRRCFDPDLFRYHDGRLRELAAGLGTVRDLDVRIVWLETELAGARYAERPGVRLLLDRARADRDRMRGPMIGMLERLATERYADKYIDFVWEGIDARG